MPALRKSLLVAFTALALPAAPALCRGSHGGALIAAVPLADVPVVTALARYHLAAASPAPHALAAAPEPGPQSALVPPPLARAFVAAPTGFTSGIAYAGMSLPTMLVDPVVAYQPRARGPRVELGVIGGGMDQKADLAHVGMQWKF